MFTVPVHLSAPLFNVLGSGTAEWPTLTAVAGWMLMAALVGSALGILRRSSAPPSAPVFHERVPISRPPRKAARVPFTRAQPKAA
jgi:hypothetical protein